MHAVLAMLLPKRHTVRRKSKRHLSEGAYHRERGVLDSLPFARLSKALQFYTPSAENRRGFRPQRHRVHTCPCFKAPKGNAASQGVARHEWEIELPPIVGSQQNAWSWRT